MESPDKKQAEEKMEQLNQEIDKKEQTPVEANDAAAQKKDNSLWRFIFIVFILLVIYGAISYSVTNFQINIGMKYYDKEEFEDACEFFLKAAEKGNKVAQYNLGMCYLEMRDDKEAMKWFRKAARQEVVEAQYQIGRYYKEKGGKDNEKKAAEWFQKAADKGSQEALNELKK